MTTGRNSSGTIWIGVLPAVAVFFFWAAVPVRAEFVVCNRSFDVVNLAIGRSVGERFETQGWWTVGTNQCATPIKEDLPARYIYVYLKDVFGRPVLAGDVPMCVGTREFSIQGLDGCRARGHEAVDFHEIDTGSALRWTLFFDPPES